MTTLDTPQITPGGDVRSERGLALAGLLVLLLVVWVMAIWRAQLIAVGPDADSDAYGHHLAARHLFVNPHNQSVHWVWLPLFHWLQVPLLLLGGGLDSVRHVNLVLWALVPLVSFGLVAWPERARANPAALGAATLAGLVLATCPLGMQLGTTGQPEPLFTLLLLAFCWAQQRARPFVAALLLAAMVLLRYEAWAILAACAAHAVLLEGLQRPGLARLRARVAASPLGALSSGWQRRQWLIVLLPAAAILLWAAVRAPFDGGRYFAFLRETHDFALDATAQPQARSAGAWLREAGLYAVVVPWRTLGWALLVAPLGLRRALKEQPWLLLAGGAVLAFVSAGHLSRATLGLERHFVAVLPLYAVLIAFGAAELARLLMAAARASLTRPNARSRLASALHACIGVAVLAAVLRVTLPWLAQWRAVIAERYPAEQNIARYLDGLPEGSRIFCDSPVVEGLVRFRPGAVERGTLADSGFRQRMREAAGSGAYFAGALAESPGESALLAPDLRGEPVFHAERPVLRSAMPFEQARVIHVLRVSP